MGQTELRFNGVLRSSMRECLAPSYALTEPLRDLYRWSVVWGRLRCDHNLPLPSGVGAPGNALYPAR